MIVRKEYKPPTSSQDVGEAADNDSHKLQETSAGSSSATAPCAALFPPRAQHVHVVLRRTSWPVSVVWALLSTLVALMSLVSLVQPEWLVRERTDVSRPPLTYDPDNLAYMLGLYGACYTDAEDTSGVLVKGDALCYRFVEASSAHEEGGSRFPSAAWRASFLLFSSGSAVLCIAAVMGILSLALQGTTNRVAATAVIGRAQAAGVLLQTSALMLLPLCLASPFTQDHCGNGAAAFSLGHCRLGWALVLAAVSTMLGVYCPLLVRFVAYHVYAPCPWNVV
ncbi:hypothetical protein V5799_009667 [Amblyomma americanum]|uniref:Uncharacterized protein n=1 Tax=Amblyomma americanum TaxID=6943 RepID=A0AAQ4F9R2_AMBAM